MRERQMIKRENRKEKKKKEREDGGRKGTGPVLQCSVTNRNKKKGIPN